MINGKMNLAFELPDWKVIGIVVATSIILAFVSTIFLRFGGKKSISQMTLPTLVIMISMGSVITKPLNENKTIIGTIISILIFLFFMILVEFISVRWNKFEIAVDSKPVLLVIDGTIQVENLKKERMTVDQLESMLRQKGIGCVKDLRTLTLEISGEIGYEEYKNYKPSKDNIFDEIRNEKNDKKIDMQLD